MKQKLVKIISKNKLLTICVYIFNNYYQNFKLKISPTKTTNSARSTVKFDLITEIYKAKDEFEIYNHFINFKNKTILELGPGAYTLNPIYCLKFQIYPNRYNKNKIY